LFSFPAFACLRGYAYVFSGPVAGDHELILLNGRDELEEPRRVKAELVSDNFFSTLKVDAILGRTFTPEHNGGALKQPVVALSHQFWQSHFPGGPKGLGQMLRFNRKPFHG